MTVRRRRTCLVVPGANARMLEKARGLAADEVVVDQPSQIEPVRVVFTPSPEEVERAERLLAAEGATRDGGEMVDAASRKLAEALLARAGR